MTEKNISRRVMRGGYSVLYEMWTRSAHRHPGISGDRFHLRGLRLCMMAKHGKKPKFVLVRGESWVNRAGEERSSLRGARVPGQHNPCHGARLCVTAKDQKR